ncbi:AAA family ATPase [Microseira sp. BLCC-F43]|uniref:AAA family ATPase n=1 Tax=Microseira sp. BLCC-F43 TaxID=3153602 RepID=UPI0035B701B0
MTMMTIPGYRVTQQLYSGSRTQVHRAICESDQTGVVLKLLLNEYPTFNELVQFRNQYTIGKNLDLPGAIKHLSLETYRNGFVLVMEDCGGVSLSDYITSLGDGENSPFTAPGILSEFLNIAIQIVQTLEGLYHNRVIHKDIKPQNILINPQTKEVKLIDFSISSLLPRENQEITNPNMLEGTLAYISPEQTGRMNRGIDYRTDFYSLGVTFYQLLTGKLPFESDDPLELVHCHIARHPTPLIEINPAIPQVLNDMVMKLMAKTAEERYQSAFGIKHDLQRCLEQYSATGSIALFELAQRDICERFTIPEKLYGRETEVATLLAAFDRVSSGSTEMMLVAGFSGIGKTAVVNEVHKPIVRQRGYFIKGKFDQFKRDIPFSAWVQAFQNLMRQLLTESTASLAAWKAKILAALGENSQVIIDVIPELELLIGKQPEVPELEGTAAQNRFNLLFEKFIRVFATQEHPLVIFLDDLQWADSASLKLMQLLMSKGDTSHLLLLGAYRDNEVFPAHPLVLTLDEIRKTEATVNQITLAPLDQSSLNRLIADTLSCPPKQAVPLTKQVLTKTKSNPFFSNQFLKSLYESGLIFFDFTPPTPPYQGGATGGWQCDIAKVRALAVSDDVVEFMATQLQKLPQNTQEVLKLAACIGNQFDLATLSIVHEKSLSETAADLWRALQEGLIIPISEFYKFFQDSQAVEVKQTSEFSVPYRFLHDRVQQAAYFLIPENQKQASHLKIGRLLLRNTTEEEREEKIFDIVNQLNIGVDLIDYQTEKDELAQLNLIAGRKAKGSTAYAAAQKYLTVGMELLAFNSWQTQYDLTLALYESGVETAYLNSDFERMEQWAEVILKEANTIVDKLKVYEVKIQAYAGQNKPLEAVNMGLQVLRQLGVSFPEEPTQLDIQRGLEETAALCAGKNIQDLINLPTMTSAEKLAAMRIVASIVPGTFIADPTLFPLIICSQVNLSLQYGNAPLSAFFYADYGIILNGVLEDVESAYQFGKLALSLIAKFNDKKLKSKVYFVVAAFIIHGKYHIRETLPLLLEGYQSGLETGDLEFVGYCVKDKCQYSYLMGQELTELEQEIRAYSQVLDNLKQETTLNFTQIFLQVVLNLLGQAENPCCLLGEIYNEEKFVPLLIEANVILGLHYIYLHKLILCYLFEDFSQAVENAAIGKQYLAGGIGFINVPVFYFYESLTALAVYANVDEFEQEKLLKQVADIQEKMQKWAHHAPMNHSHKFNLVEAERHRVMGQNVEAMDYYDRAIALAQENKYVNEEALANELAAKFYLGWGKQTIAQTYLTNAYYCYARWGAKAKLADLEKRYPQLLAPILVQAKTPKLGETIFQKLATTLSSSSSSSGSSDVLDLATVLKASQALSSEIHLDKLLSTLMRVVLENAGASKCALILSQTANLVIEATGVAGGEITVLQSMPVEESQEIPVSLINYVYRTRETLVLDNPDAQNSFSADPYIIANQPKSLLCTPIVNQGKLVGILYLENHLTTKAFTTDRLAVLNILSSQAAISIANAKLYEEVTASERRLTQYLEAMPVGVSVHQPNGQLYYTNQVAQELLGIKVIPEAKTEQLSETYQVYRAGTNQLYPTDQLPIARSLSGEPAKADDLELHHPNQTIALEISTTPIFDKTGKIVYAIAAFQDITQRKQAEKLIAEYNRTLEEQVKERTAQLAAANQEIMALNSRLKEENLRLSAELEVTRKLQQMILPKQSELESIEGLEIAGFMQPADEVGGDYYDVLQQDGNVKISIGDVTGHGLESGVLMLMTQTAVRTLQESNQTDPVQFLDILNRTIYHNIQRINPDKNLTLALLDYADGILKISGQHEEIIVVRAGGQVERIDTINLGFPIGLDEEIADFIASEQVQLNPGDVVVLYTDGITEAENINCQLYGVERLCEIVKLNCARSPQEIRQAVIEDVRRHIGEQKVFDDITLVVLKQK